MLNRDKVIISLKNVKVEENSNIKFQELSFVKKINLRGNPHNSNFISLCSKILNVILPTEPNTYVNNGKIKVIWLSPNEWLIVDEKDNNENDLFSKLQSNLGDNETSVTDVSENRIILRISGEKLFTLLAKFLVLDLEKNFPNRSSAVQTIFVKVPILIVRLHLNNEEPNFDFFINRSHANYIYEILFDGTKNLNY